MISSIDIQNAYINLYKKLREYIWSAPVIEIIADLETAVYETFPDMGNIRKQFKLLKYELYDILRDDEEMRDVVDAFEDTISDDIGYSRLEKVQEVL
jgi:hypothetical protein